MIALACRWSIGSLAFAALAACASPAPERSAQASSHITQRAAGVDGIVDVATDSGATCSGVAIERRTVLVPSSCLDGARSVTVLTPAARFPAVAVHRGDAVSALGFAEGVVPLASGPLVETFPSDFFHSRFVVVGPNVASTGGDDFPCVASPDGRYCLGPTGPVGDPSASGATGFALFVAEGGHVAPDHRLAGLLVDLSSDGVTYAVTSASIVADLLASPSSALDADCADVCAHADRCVAQGVAVACSDAP